jgi:hypothetical protein
MDMLQRWVRDLVVEQDSLVEWVEEAGVVLV